MGKEEAIKKLRVEAAERISLCDGDVQSIDAIDTDLQIAIANLKICDHFRLNSNGDYCTFDGFPPGISVKCDAKKQKLCKHNTAKAIIETNKYNQHLLDTVFSDKGLKQSILEDITHDNVFKVISNHIKKHLGGES